MDPATVAFIILLCAVTAALLWMMWLYLILYKRNRELERDNYRLIRRLGQYHSVSLGVPEEAIILPQEPTVPPFFRTKKPMPPPGWKPGPGKGDL